MGLEIKDIQEYIQQYERKMGYGRWVVKSEPHIKELNDFIIQLSAEGKTVFSSNDLLKLVQIILRKKNRDNVQLSSQVFISLANYFGGYDILESLNEVALLNEKTTELLLNNALTPKLLFSGIIDHQTLIYVLQRVSVPLGFKVTPHHLTILNFLQDQGFPSTALVGPLIRIDVAHLPLIEETISLLKSASEPLFTLANVIKIFKLQQSDQLNTLLNQIKPLTEKKLNCLFNSQPISLTRYGYVIELIDDFKEMRWNYDDYLVQLLSDQQLSETFKKAIHTIKELNILPTELEYILSTFFLKPEDCNKLAHAIRTLSEYNLVKNDIEAVFDCSITANTVAMAINALKKSNIYNPDTSAIICSKPGNALTIAQFIAKLQEADYLTPRAIEALAAYPDCIKHYLGFATLRLSPSPLLGDSAALDCLLLLLIMEKNKILSQRNLDNVQNALLHLKSLTRAVEGLDKINLMDESNFDCLVIVPENAITFARELGACIAEKGKPVISSSSHFFTPQSNSDFVSSSSNQHSSILIDCLHAI